MIPVTLLHFMVFFVHSLCCNSDINFHLIYSYDYAKMTCASMCLADATTWPLTGIITYKTLSGRIPNLFPRFKRLGDLTQRINQSVRSLDNAHWMIQKVTPYLIESPVGRTSLATAVTCITPANRIFLPFHLLLFFPIFYFISHSGYCKQLLGIDNEQL